MTPHPQRPTKAAASTLAESLTNPASLPILPRKPDAQTLTVSDILERAARGLVRVPEFQRSFRWEPEDIRALFDSLYRGYPIGTLLMWKRSAQAQRVVWGSSLWSSLSVMSPSADDMWWIVDGQQRVTSLVAAMYHPHPWSDPKDPFAVFLDLQQQKFVGVPRRAPEPLLPLLPVSLLRDATELGLWSSQWLQAGGDVSQVRLAHEVGKRLREYSVPLYIVETDNEQVLREVFHRTNNAGKRLEATEIFDSLFTRNTPSTTHTLEEVAQDLSGLGMGAVKPARLLQALLALEGLDVTRRAEDQTTDRARFIGRLPAASAAFAQVLRFLREDAQIPHLDLLPYHAPLTVLTRYFGLHPDPHPRNRRLLVRWVWRGMLSEQHDSSHRTLLRQAVSAIDDDETQSVQRLLKTLPLTLGRDRVRDLVFERTAFDLRSAQCRVGALRLVSLQPRHLITGELLNLNDLFERYHHKAFLRIDKSAPRCIENMILHPPLSPARIAQAIALREKNPQHDVVLASHGISSPEQRVQLVMTGLVEFEREISLLKQRAKFFIDGWAANDLAEWGASDRPAISYLLNQEEDEGVNHG